MNCRHQKGPASAATGEHGNVLAILLLSIIPVVGIISAFYLRTTMEISRHQGRKNEMRATYRALGALEVARNEILNSTYTSANNDRIRTALAQNTTASLRPDPGGAGYLAFESSTGRTVRFATTGQLGANQHPFRRFSTVGMVNEAAAATDAANNTVPVYIANITGLWHVIEARATLHGVTRTARVLVRERDPFSRFGVFINSHYQGISESPKGDIHTNKTLQIFFPGSVFDDYVSAHTGFQWMIGAGPENTTFKVGSNPGASAITMPSLAEVAALRNFASGHYYIDSTYRDTEVRFAGTRVTITAVSTVTGLPVTLLDHGTLPADGVIYSEGNIKVLEGDLTGRVTVGCGSATGVTITGSLRYVDDQGQPAMLHPTHPEHYVRNPAYTGTSALGVISNGPVLYSHSVPNTLELHAAIFSRSGNVGLPGLSFTADGAYCAGYDASFQKTNLNILGCTISDKRWVGTVVNSAGTVLSGFRDGAIEYDRSMLNDPPPHFLEIDRPMFKGVEILENQVDI